MHAMHQGRQGHQVRSEPTARRGLSGEPDESLQRFRETLARGLAELESRRSEINDLNVFPVADGDTGDNMTLTIRAVVAELDKLAEESCSREVTREEIINSVARAALLGARGNSGVILSQLIRGAAEELASRVGEPVDPVLIGAAMSRAVDHAYRSVREPVEGTILTVAREMSHSISSDLPHVANARLAPGVAPADQDAILAEVLVHALQAGQRSVERTPELLPALREAGVVDAGGYGLTVLLAGVLGGLMGAEAPQLDHHAPPLAHGAVQHSSESFRYCTNFAVSGDRLESRDFVEPLEAIGDSVLVVGDTHVLRVHIHTDEPERALEIFDSSAEVSHVEIADMHEQVAERTERLAAAEQTESALLAVVVGDGLRAEFEGLGVITIDGGATMNPSIDDLLKAIEAAPAREVVVLTNNSNVRMAADEAQGMASKPVEVVPTSTLQGGLAAAIEFRSDSSAADNRESLAEAIESVSTGGIAPAARDDAAGRFKAGDSVGYIEGELVAWGDPSEILCELLAKIGEGRELITCLSGEDAPLTSDQVVELAPEGAAELEVRPGGQPHWYWLLLAE